MSDDSDVSWTPAETARFEADLRPIDERLRQVARAFRCKYASTAGRGWPGRRILKRVGLRTYELKLMLNPDYLQDGSVHYELREQWMYDFGEIVTKLLAHRLLATFEPQALPDGSAIEDMIVTRLRHALRR